MIALPFRQRSTGRRKIPGTRRPGADCPGWRTAQRETDHRRRRATVRTAPIWPPTRATARGNVLPRVQAEAAGRGKPAKAALTATARRLAGMCNGMIADKTRLREIQPA